jgi:uncharacterized ferritin-like protein (DUF455 family)
MSDLAGRAALILATPEPDRKIALSRALATAWRVGEVTSIGTALPPARPARGLRPEILPPGKMKRRGPGGAGKAALIHALAHIEFNAIDLAWDIVARYGDLGLPRDFYDDWVSVAADETLHFALLRGLLDDLGHDYGDFPAHGGLWDAAEKTRGDLQARLAVVPLTLEARALDTAPPLITKLRQAGDQSTLTVMQRILADEITHVAIGSRWFAWVCERRGEDPTAAFHRLVAPHFPKGLKPPFNDSDRQKAGMPAEFYQPLAVTASCHP